MNKICTNINQSKKLIELGININTANMLWTYDFMVNDINGLNVISEQLKPEEKDIPAWSLTALLNVLPQSTNISTPKPINALSYCCWNQYEEIYANNPVDACYEMILKLHEQKLL